MRQPIKNNNNKPKKVKKVLGKKKKHPQYGTSKLEEYFASEFLDKLGVEYEYQFEAKDIGRFYDFFIPKSRLIIEVDGDFNKKYFLYKNFMKKLTTEQFIEQAKEVHGYKYDYSKVEYINNSTKVCIICPIHGEFWQRPSDHLNGCGCQECSGVKKMTTKCFIEKAKKIHGNKYDYSKVEYINSKTKVCIICNEKDKYGVIHGEFWQRPNDHLNGYSCPKCNNEYIPKTNEWVERAKKVHGDKYDYSKVEYINAKTKVCIICPIHGEFWQIPNNHLNGNNCPNCNSNIKSKNEKLIYSFLKEHNINFEREKTFEWLKNKSNLYLDFFLTDYNIAIEYQGEQHYKPIKRFGGEDSFNLIKERDNKKMELCNEHNIKIYYFNRSSFELEKILSYINETTNKK